MRPGSRSRRPPPTDPDAIADAQQLAADIHMSHTEIGARSPYYGAFLYVTQKIGTLWLTAVVQAAIGAWLVLLLWRAACPRAPPWTAYAVQAFVAFGSTLPFFAGFAMPDVFAGYAAVATTLVMVFWDRLHLAERIALFVLLVFSMVVHEFASVEHDRHPGGRDPGLPHPARAPAARVRGRLHDHRSRACRNRRQRRLCGLCAGQDRRRAAPAAVPGHARDRRRAWPRVPARRVRQERRRLDALPVQEPPERRFPGHALVRRPLEGHLQRHDVREPPEDGAGRERLRAAARSPTTPSDRPGPR